ncbi:hypothetical protein [Desulfatitalea alkaliphila]|uniref:Uncharacterized protein n=1 Tax=Desulfatitalea alkaliphila TaxID=2929485 RepID=A0AA41R890_9BACT|nr:hypothetical protein [Desulfatitalea alkaliphila]MCJ8502840.1 hypothetical protein [Desulfatitalea alkaliphila]
MDTRRRSAQDRRSGKDRRHLARLKQLINKGSPPRSPQDRRTTPERRSGWVRLTKWSSVYLDNLKLARWLKRF